MAFRERLHEILNAGFGDVTRVLSHWGVGVRDMVRKGKSGTGKECPGIYRDRPERLHSWRRTRAETSQRLFFFHSSRARSRFASFSVTSL